MHRVPLPALAFLVVTLLGAAGGARAGLAQSAEPLAFEISFTKEFSRHPLSGQVYLILSRELVGEPRRRLNDWKSPAFIFRHPVHDLEPGEVVRFDAETPGFPVSLDELPPAPYAIQAVLDLDPLRADFALRGGNGRSRLKREDLHPARTGTVRIDIDTEIWSAGLVDLPRIQYRKLESRHVGRHMGDRFFATAAIVLPTSYSRKDKDARKYPVQYWIPALGETARGALKYFQSRGIFSKPPRAKGDIDDFIYVLIDCHGPHGHHGWVDSEVNGPLRRALVEELIPHIEAEFPIIGEPSSRFLVGYGLGGWSALWQVAQQPDFFAGAWALAPDPVDFRDFYGLDLYARPTPNAYVDSRDRPRPLARKNGKIVLDIRTQAALERVDLSAGQLRSFEAMFSRRGANGEPMPLFDRATGAVDSEVAQDWASHDLRGFLQRNWLSVGPKLQGKMHMYVGDQDSFFLDAPTRLLREFLVSVNSDAVVEILPKVDHAGINARAIHTRIQKDITRTWRASRQR